MFKIAKSQPPWNVWFNDGKNLVTKLVCLLSSLNGSQCLFNPVCFAFYGFYFVLFASVLIRVISMEGGFLTWCCSAGWRWSSV